MNERLQAQSCIFAGLYPQVLTVYVTCGGPLLWAFAFPLKLTVHLVQHNQRLIHAATAAYPWHDRCNVPPVARLRVCNYSSRCTCPQGGDNYEKKHSVFKDVVSSAPAGHVCGRVRRR